MSCLIRYSPAGTIILRQGLERLAYLQGDGIAYIDTGTKLNYSSVNNIHVICTNDFEDKQTAAFIGTNSYQTGFMALYHYTDNRIHDRYITGKYYTSYNIPVGNKINFLMLLDYKNLKCSCWLNSNKDINRTITKGTDSSNIYFFKGSVNNYPATKCKCYEVSINIDGGDLKYFIPVRVKSDVTIAGTSYSAGTLGMYDYINDKLYTNAANSGEFIAGPEVPLGFPTSEYCLVEWLEGVSLTSTLIPCYRRSDLQSGTYNLSTRIFTAVNGKIGPSITFGWGEVMNGAYIEPIQTSLSLPDKIDIKSTVKIDKVAGGVIGLNQYAKRNNADAFSLSGVTVKYNDDGSMTINGTATDNILKYGYWNIRMSKIAGLIAGEKILCGINIISGTKTGNVKVMIDGYKCDSAVGVNNSCALYSIYRDSKGKANCTMMPTIETGDVFDNLTFKYFWIRLQTFFPLDQSFVTSLGTNDAPKVLNKLGFQVYEESNEQITLLNDEVLKLGAKVISKMGYLEPKLVLSSIGRINLIDNITGLIKQSLDLRKPLKTVWDLLLSELSTKNISIPQILQLPRFFSINNQVGVFLKPDCLEVSAWIVDLGSLSWQYHGDTTNNGTFSAELLSRAEGTQISLLTLGYSSGRHYEDISGLRNADNKTINWYYVQNSTLKTVYIRDDAYNSNEEFTTAMQGQYLIYQLAEPITIPFNTNLTFSEVNKNDIITLDDYEGNSMYNVDITTNNEIRRTSIYPNPDWVELNKQLPATVESALKMIKLTNAIPHNISSGEGRFGINTAFDFSSTNAYLNTNGLATGKTYMGWFYTVSKPTTEVFFADDSSGMAFGTNVNGTKAIISTENALNKVFTLSTWNTGWNHIAVVKANSGPQLYINGIAQTATSNTNGWTHSGGLWIGARSTFDSNFSGRCQDFKVFDTALTLAQIQQEM